MLCLFIVRFLKAEFLKLRLELQRDAKASKEVTKSLTSKQLSTCNCYLELCSSEFEEVAFTSVILFFLKKLDAISAEECGMNHHNK